MDQSMTPEQAAQLIGMIKYAREVEQRKAQHAQAAFDGVREFVEALVRGESPALRADRDDAREVLNEFVSSADAAVKAQLGKSSTSHELLNTRSAAGIVAECWRDVLEPWHYYFSDAEMAWMRRRRCRHRSGKVTCTYFLDEFGLHQRVGGAEVHAGQLLHLLFMANRPNIRIRIVPAAHDAHAGLVGPFTQLTFTKYEPLVWVQTENSSLLDEAKDAIDGYEAVVRALEEQSLYEALQPARDQAVAAETRSTEPFQPPA
jgi:hypothetical protein